MPSYDYDAYIGANGGEVRISRRNPTAPAPVPVVDLALDWTDVEPFEIALGDGLVVAVYPYRSMHAQRHITRRFAVPGLASWGRCTAFVRRWGATMPLAIEDPRVLAALREREQFEAFARLVVGDGE